MIQGQPLLQKHNKISYAFRSLLQKTPTYSQFTENPTNWVIKIETCISQKESEGEWFGP